MSATTIVVGGITFHGTDPGTDDVFLLVDHDGLNNRPSSSGESAPRLLAPGEFLTPVFPTARFPMLAGRARASSEASLRSMRDDFNAILADDEVGPLVWTELGETWTTYVQVFGDTTFKRRRGVLEANCSMKFRAVDPLLYSGETSKL